MGASATAATCTSCELRVRAPGSGGAGRCHASHGAASGARSVIAEKLDSFAEVPSLTRAVSSAGRAPALQAGGHWFESSTAHYYHYRSGYLLTVMRFAISIPQYARGSQFDAGAFRSHLRRVEELGLFESGWVQEQVIGAAGGLAPIETLTYAAACTERLRLACAVFVLPLHNPLH